MGAGIVESCFSSGNVYGKKGAVGGFSGFFEGSTVKNCYASGNVESISSHVGGFMGRIKSAIDISNCYSSGTVTSTTPATTGGFCGSSVNNSSTMSNCVTLDSSYTKVIGNITNAGVSFMSLDEINQTYTNESMGFTEENGWKVVKGELHFLWEKFDTGRWINLQVGSTADWSSRVSFDIGFNLLSLDNLRTIGLEDSNHLNTIDTILHSVADKQTYLGSAASRINSVLDEINIQYENLVSSRSTLRDADVAKVSASYIQQQILQQASATLLATANQSPSIALQLI